MPQQDTTPTKDKIIEVIKRKGPSLPVHIANEMKLSMLFASAFLADLLSNKEIKISHMKVGNTPIYLIAGQESQLEKYSQHLKSREKDAFLLLKENKFLEDAKQEPAIRVALRAIKDFAIPFQSQTKIIWRYFTIPESEYLIEKTEEIIEEGNKEKEIASIKNGERSESNKEGRMEEQTISEKTLEPQESKLEPIFDKKPKKKKLIKKSSSKQNQKFFEKVKESLTEKSIEILDIIGVSKNELILKVKESEQEQIIIAYNKKRIDETDITNAHKKASELNLPYSILAKGDQTKKLTELLEAAKSLQKVGKFE